MKFFTFLFLLFGATCVAQTEPSIITKLGQTIPLYLPKTGGQDFNFGTDTVSVLSPDLNLKFGKMEMVTEPHFAIQAPAYEFDLVLSMPSASIKIKPSGDVLLCDDTGCDTLNAGTEKAKTIGEGLITFFKEQGRREYELSKKVRFYEKYYGKIEGSLDEDCVKILPPSEARKACIKN